MQKLHEKHIVLPNHTLHMIAMIAILIKMSHKFKCIKSINEQYTIFFWNKVD